MNDTFKKEDFEAHGFILAKETDEVLWMTRDWMGHIYVGGTGIRLCYLKDTQCLTIELCTPRGAEVIARVNNPHAKHIDHIVYTTRSIDYYSMNVIGRLEWASDEKTAIVFIPDRNGDIFCRRSWEAPQLQPIKELDKKDESVG